MKNYLILTTIISMVILSCQKSVDVLQTSKNKDKEMSYLSITDIEAQKIVYNIMTGQDRYNLWMAHLDTARSYFVNETAKYNLITDVMNFLSPQVFEDTTGAYDGDIAVFMYQASQIFANDTLEFLIFSYLDTDLLDDYIMSGMYWITMAPIDDGEDGGGNGSNNCTCNSESYNHCSLFVYDAGSGTLIPTQKCTKNYEDCKPTITGCGWLWKLACNGKCEAIHY